MTELDALIERLRTAYSSADRAQPGRFRFVASVAPMTGGCVCVVVIAAEGEAARVDAAKALTG